MCLSCHDDVCPSLCLPVEFFFVYALFVVNILGLSLCTVSIFSVGCITFGPVSFLSVSIWYKWSSLCILTNLSVHSISLSSDYCLLPFCISFLRYSSTGMGVAVMCCLVLATICPAFITLQDGYSHCCHTWCMVCWIFTIGLLPVS